jgi:hypothetical protein
MDLRSDPRSDPRLIKVLAPPGLDHNVPPPEGLSRRSSRRERRSMPDLAPGVASTE